MLQLLLVNGRQAAHTGAFDYFQHAPCLLVNAHRHIASRVRGVCAAINFMCGHLAGAVIGTDSKKLRPGAD